MHWVQLHLKISYFYFHGWFVQIFNSNISIWNWLPKLKSQNHAKKKPMIKTLKNAFKNLKKYVWVTAHLNFNFWYCNPISKAKQGHKLKFSCPKWAFCHKSSLLFSFLSCPTQLLERGESQHVKYFLGTGNYFFSMG